MKEVHSPQHQHGPQVEVVVVERHAICGLFRSHHFVALTPLLPQEISQIIFLHLKKEKKP